MRMHRCQTWERTSSLFFFTSIIWLLLKGTNTANEARGYGIKDMSWLSISLRLFLSLRRGGVCGSRGRASALTGTFWLLLHYRSGSTSMRSKIFSVVFITDLACAGTVSCGRKGFYNRMGFWSRTGFLCVTGFV